MKRKKNVLITFQSNALGDNIAWIPYVEEYRKVNDCNVFCYTFFNNLFQKVYPYINFIPAPDQIDCEIDLVIPLGFYIYDHIPVPEIHKDLDLHVDHNLQEFACKLLRLKYQEIKPKIHVGNKMVLENNMPYISIGVHSTAQCKYWNYPNGWQEVVGYLNKINYDVYSVDQHAAFGTLSYTNMLPNNIKNNNQMFGSLEQRISAIYNSYFFIGLSSGMSWLAWALDKPVILISGFTDPKLEFQTPYRLINRSVCNSCFTNRKNKFNQTEWNWCPEHKNTKKMFECSKSISPNDVKQAINSVDANILFNKIDKEIIATENYCQYLNSIGISNTFVEINPGNGCYTKIFAKYFKNVICISHEEPDPEFKTLKNSFNNISFHRKNTIHSSFWNNIFDYVYINLSKNTNTKTLKEEIEFWRNQNVKSGIGGHAWRKDYVQQAVLSNFAANTVMILKNNSWSVLKNELNNL